MGTLRGRLGRAGWDGVWGWALDAGCPAEPVVLEILENETVIGCVRADQPRPHLTQFPPEQRNCGFQFRFPNGLSGLEQHIIRVRRATDGAELPRSPAMLEPPAHLDAAAEQTLATALKAAIATAEAEAQLDSPLRFVADRIEQLLAARTELPGGGPPPAEALAWQERWHTLAEADVDESAAALAGARRVLVIGDCPPAIDFMARGLIAHIGVLRRLGLRVDFAATEFFPSAEAHRAAIAAEGATCLHPPLYPTVEDVLRRNRGLFDVICLHRITNFERYAALARCYCPKARIVFSVGSLHFVRLLRRGAVQQWPVLAQAGQVLRIKELMAAWAAHAVVTHSTTEANILRTALPQARVHCIAWPAAPQPRTVPFAERRDIAFIGDFTQQSDLDAVTILADHIMPELWQTDPSVQCLLAGSEMPAELRALSRPGIVPLGAVAEAALFDRVRLTVAPQRTYSGLNPAAVASLAAGVPCVMAPHVAEALEPDEALRAALVATDVVQVAALIGRLHAEEAANRQASEAGLQFVAQTLPDARVEDAMQDAIGSVPARPVEAVAAR